MQPKEIPQEGGTNVKNLASDVTPKRPEANLSEQRKERRYWTP